MNIADRIQHLRKQKGISQEVLADNIGVSRQAVSKWESEQSMPDIEKIIAMSDFFAVTTDYLLKGIDPAALISKRTNSKLLLSSAVIVAIIAGISAFWGNCFQSDEILLISLAGAAAGYGIGSVLEIILGIRKKQA